jgi:hypothetical protein
MAYFYKFIGEYIFITRQSTRFNREFPLGFEMMTDALFEAILT